MKTFNLIFLNLKITPNLGIKKQLKGVVCRI